MMMAIILENAMLCLMVSYSCHHHYHHYHHYLIIIVSGNAESLAPIISEMYHLDWIHSITAGIDHLICPEITQLQGVTITNAKGIYSSSLAEYVMAACSYFNKDIPRLIQNKNDKKWDRFTVGELKGKCLGIIGYGDIGSATARLANAYGMKVLALRKRPELSADDHWVDRVYGIDGLATIMAESDFIVVALALTKDTIHFIKEKHFKRYNFIVDNNISLILI